MKKLLIVLAVLWLLAAPMSFSCLCREPSPEEAFAESDAIFIGIPRESWMKQVQSLGMDYPYQYVEVTFRVETAWKGTEENVAVVLMPLSDGSCGYYLNQFDTQSHYLIYARYDAPSSLNRSVPPAVLSGSAIPLWTTICSRDAVIDGPILVMPKQAVDFNGPEVGQQDIQLLGAGIHPSPSGDVDRDGGFTLADVQLALRAVVGKVALSAAQRIAGDMNEDDRLDLKDVTLLLRRTVGLPVANFRGEWLAEGDVKIPASNALFVASKSEGRISSCGDSLAR